MSRAPLAAVLLVALLATATQVAAGKLPAADVVAVTASGAPGSYQFSVTIRSPDKGCAQYADWWEVLDASGKLLYRRVLLHSHVDEQPFTRSGGPVPAAAGATLWVRAHMSTGAYLGTAMTGSVAKGFGPAPRDAARALPDHSTAAPLPEGCAF